MRTHQKIVQDRGASALVRDLAGLGIAVHQTTPQRWADRDSIPAEFWKPLVDLQLTTLDELAQAADERRLAKAARASEGAAA